LATKQIYKYILAIALPLIVFSCKSTRWVDDGEFLLVENEIFINNKKVKNAELQSLLKQKPNKELTPIFRPYLSLYNVGNPNKEKGLAHWFTRIGEAPVIADSTTILGSATNLGLFYFSNGFFNNVTAVETKVNIKKKKAKVRYDVYTGSPHYFGSLDYLIASENIENLVLNDSINKSLIKQGEKYSNNTLEAEREKLVKLFRNNGFYGFQKELIRFEADTLHAKNSVNLTMVISDQPVYFKDSTYLKPHKPYTISNVYIDPYYSYVGEPEKKDTSKIDSYTFLDSEKNKFSARLPISAIHFGAGEKYNQTKVIESYSHISSLRVFRNSEILFEPSESNENDLKAVVRLKPFPQRSIKLDLEGTNTSGRYGIFGTISVLNRNLFKNGEIFDISLNGGIESQFDLSVESVNDAFNVYEYGAQIGISFPRFFAPKSIQRKIPKQIIPKSRLSVSGGRQNRQEFVRNYFNLGLGYFWKPSENINMNFQLFDFSFLDLVKIDSAYENSLEFSQGYQDVLISASRFTFIFSNQNAKHRRNSSYFIGSAETAGNFLNLLDQAKPDPTTSETLLKNNNRKGYYFGVPYSQYFKIDLDYRHYTRYRSEQVLAWRFMAGYTHTYSRSKNQLPPFEKSYFAGGTNDIRGFRAYRLGPGNYRSENYEEGGVIYNAVAPIKLMFNIEYRFTILKSLKGALFTDVGNIWIYDNPNITALTGVDEIDAEIESYKFKWENLNQQIAISSGLGVRYDFGFFVFRLDAAIPIFDPRREGQDRFRPNYSGWFFVKDFQFNLGIGYPF
jgi:outer membrane protein assembly factor BamA